MSEQTPSLTPAAGPGGILALLSQRRAQLALILLLAILAVWFAAQWLPVPVALVAGLTLACIGLWATALVPEYWPALAFFLLAMVLELAPAQTVFSGFSSSAFWLLFSGLVLGAAITHTGLDQRAARLLALITGQSYRSVITAVVLFSLALAFLIPSSMGRVVLLVPVVLALAEQLGYGTGSNGRQGMLAAAVFGTFLPAFAILPANGPNMILAGLVEAIHGFQLPYFDYLLLHFPVLGLVKAAVLVLVILRLLPDRDPQVQVIAATVAEPLSTPERRLLWVLGACLTLWFSDALHQISPGWIGLAAALACLWPGSGLTAKNCLNSDIKYGPLLFVAGIMGLGSLIASSGLGEALLQGLLGFSGFSADQPLWNGVLLTAISSLIALLTNLPGVPAIMTPVAGQLADATGLPLMSVLMTQVIAFSNVLLPFQAPPLVAAMQLGELSVKLISKLCLIMFALSTLFLIPLHLLWWVLLGYI
ncbi:SLC13 family permease [Marinobacterium jannaschii]|uniref:SLC13 family permease n=1 Tax=Marinobacterium jannaschii TaxID=64970 RepID=UPI0004856196|nr:SLC13 family permease [Marinobacterium jannaschii]